MIPPVVVIHCRELAQRTAAARAHFAEVGIAPIWWQAPHGVSWGLATTNPFDPGKFISPGHVSLLLAHWHVWEYLRHTLPTDDSAAMVCEDDCVFPPDFRERYAAVRHELNVHLPDWQFVFIGLAEQNNPGVWNKIDARIGGPTSQLCTVKWPFGTHCYLVRRSALDVMQRQFPPASRNMDQQLYQRVLAPNHVRWCAVLPTLVSQKTFDYTGSGSPEWAPSTVTPHDGPPVVRAGAVNQEIQHALVNDRGVTAPRSAAWPEPLPGTPGTPTRTVPVPHNLSADRQSLVEPPHHQSAETVAATLRLTEPYPCIYRGESAAPVLAGGRVVPTWECARLNAASHQRRGTDAPGAVACEPCKLRLEMGAAGVDRPRLPLPDGHFNPSVIVWNDRVVLATRDSWGHSRVGLWELTNPEPDWSGDWVVKPIGSCASGHPDAPRLEDPRLFAAPHPDTGEPALHASFSMPDGYPPKFVRVGVCRFSGDLSRIEHTEIYPSPRGSAYEKNWMPFVTGRLVNWVYSGKPDHVVFHSPTTRQGNWTTPNDFAWTGGVVRGGCPPVLHAGVYYHFFHGCLKRPHGNVYTVGCYTFDPDPPFRVLAMTPTPLVWPDLPGPGEAVVKRYVVFPGGAIPHAGHWHLACGIDDTFCRIIRLSFTDVDAALARAVADTGGVVSIRDTAINLGTKRE